MSLIRYPGSKEKLASIIIKEKFPIEASAPLWMNSNQMEYREPFFGAGAVGFRVLEYLPPGCRAWINDLDYGLVCLWNSVKSKTEHLKLCRMVDTFIPSVDCYHKFKEKDGQRDLDPAMVGFRKLALHQMSYSGLGFKSGGPLGGKKQNNELYSIDCRWRPENLVSDIIRLHKLLSRTQIKITCKDFSALIDDNPQVFLYLDPPYYDKGEELYKFSMSDDDHTRLADALKHGGNSWVLSYDNHPFIRDLYQEWAYVYELNVHYSIATGQNRKNKEVLISNQVMN